MWWVFVIIVVTLYSGELVRFLTFPVIEQSVQSIGELLAMENAAEDVTWGILNGRQGYLICARFFVQKW